MHPELGQVQRSWKRRLSWLRHCHIPYSHRITLRIWLSGLGTDVCLQSLGMASVYSSMSAEPAGMTPEQFTTFLDAEYEKWHRLIQDVGITATP